MKVMSRQIYVVVDRRKALETFDPVIVIGCSIDPFEVVSIVF